MAFSGFAAIGGAVLGVTGVGVATVAVGVITSAVVGAAIGGLSAAITGGDIGKGLLFGALGGIVTGGLAGGLIAPETFAINAAEQAAGSTTSIAAAMDSPALGGPGIETTKEVVKETTLFGGGLMDGAAGHLIAAAGSLFTEKPEVAYSQTKEGIAAQLASNERIANIRKEAAASSHAPNYSREVAEINTASAERQLADTIKANTADIKLQQEGKITELQTTAGLTEDAAQAEWDRVMGKKADAATAASSVKYTGGDVYEAVRDKQRGMLGGPEEASV